jgi:hypothetical protein
VKLRVIMLAVTAIWCAAPGQGQAQETCNVGIWYPYTSSQGVPPISAFNARGLSASLIDGDLTNAALSTYDVLFIGRNGTGNWGGDNVAITDIDALINWVDAGGGIVSESTSPIYESDSVKGEPWSSRISEVLGVTGAQSCCDSGVSNPTITITNPAHPIAQGIPASFTLNGTHAYNTTSAIDTAKNPTAVQVGTTNSNPIIASQYGAGYGVYFPAAVGYQGMDWDNNVDYENLFLNGIQYACSGGGGIVADSVPVPTMSPTRLAVLMILVLATGLVFVRRQT